MASATPDRQLLTLLLGNVIIGTGVLLPAGMLTQVAKTYEIDVATAGVLMLAGGLVVGLGAPLFAALTSRFDRRKLLAAALLAYVLGHAASAIAPSFVVLVALRAFTVVGAAVFTPQAAAAAGLLVPPERRAGAIAYIFTGWSIASVAGIPIGAWLGEAIGWQATFALMACLSVAGLALVWLSLPAGLHVPPLDRSAWRGAVTRPTILAVLMVTLLSGSGQFTLFTYLEPIAKTGFGASAIGFSLLLLTLGIAGVGGNMLASRLVGRLGADRSVALALLALIAGFGTFTVGFGVFTVAIGAAALWGMGTFSSNSLQQSRLVGLAPPLASATVALNTSAVYLGQAVGAAAGGALIEGGPTAAMGLVALGFATAALAVSLSATRLSRA